MCVALSSIFRGHRGVHVHLGEEVLADLVHLLALLPLALDDVRGGRLRPALGRLRIALDPTLLFLDASALSKLNSWRLPKLIKIK